jgi:hypothetical protein
MLVDSVRRVLLVPHLEGAEELLVSMSLSVCDERVRIPALTCTIVAAKMLSRRAKNRASVRSSRRFTRSIKVGRCTQGTNACTCRISSASDRSREPSGFTYIVEVQ